MGKAEIIWTEAALSNVNAIGAHIAVEASSEMAGAFVERLFESTDRLEDFPYSGAETQENPAFRHVVVSGYRVIYRVLEAVEVIAVIAPGQDAVKILTPTKK